MLAAACGSSGGDDPAVSTSDTEPAEVETDDGDSGEEAAPDGVDTPEDEPDTDDGDSGEGDGADDLGFVIHNVPEDFPTIQAAVDAAGEGELILIAPGTYNEAVDVTTNDLVIRGVDRNTVILDGNFELENGIRVLGADGVAVENMTAMNYTKNGFFWTTDVNGYRGSYLNAIRNGDYGVYAFGARDGLLEHSYASGSPDAGFYIGQCFPCNAVIDNVISEFNGLGYSGTNSGGNLYIVNSTWRNNRAGVVPNSGSYEGCAPERETTIIGNIIHSNSNDETSSIDVALLAQGNGIVVAGGLDNTIERNLIFDHDVSGIALAPFPENDPLTGIPENPSTDCLEDVVPVSPEEAESLPASLFWEPARNVVRGNVITDSRRADLILATDASQENRFCENEFAVSLPADIETVAPCEGNDFLEVGGEGLGVVAEALARVNDETPNYADVDLPDPGPQPNMENPETAEPRPARTPEYPDTDAIGVPEKP